MEANGGPEFGPIQPPLQPGERMFESEAEIEIPDFAQSERGEIIGYFTFDLESSTADFTEGPFTAEVIDADVADRVVVHWFDSEGGEHYHTVEGIILDDDYTLDDVIDDLEKEYG